jgi:hypothetical protein
MSRARMQAREVNFCQDFRSRQMYLTKRSRLLFLNNINQLESSLRDLRDTEGRILGDLTDFHETVFNINGELASTNSHNRI